MASIPNDTYRPAIANRDAARAILIVTADQTEDLEFFYPYYRFIEAGFRVDVATPKGGAFAAKHGLGLQESMKIADVDAADYELLYIPGGKAPEALKKSSEAIEITKQFFEQGKPIAAVCHGPQLLAKAGIIEGRTIAAWPECEEEVRAAGATYVNQETATDGPFVTARWPGDLPAHLKETFVMLSKAGERQPRKAAA